LMWEEEEELKLKSREGAWRAAYVRSSAFDQAVLASVRPLAPPLCWPESHMCFPVFHFGPGTLCLFCSSESTAAAA
jgi:hypothetical protein